MPPEGTRLSEDGTCKNGSRKEGQEGIPALLKGEPRHLLQQALVLVVGHAHVGLVVRLARGDDHGDLVVGRLKEKNDFQVGYGLWRLATIIVRLLTGPAGRGG